MVINAGLCKTFLYFFITNFGKTKRIDIKGLSKVLVHNHDPFGKHWPPEVKLRLLARIIMIKIYVIVAVKSEG